MRPGFTGAARVSGVVGQPIAHSLSPLLHNTWITAADLDAVYVPFAPADGSAFDALIQAGRHGAFVGLNVTAPFKEQAIARADHVSARAEACGSANLLTFRDGRVHADSTDGRGLMIALAEQAPALVLKDIAVTVLGAGGAARAAVAALIEAGTADVRIVNRTADRARALADAFPGHARVVSIEEALNDCRLVVNALSVAPEIDMSRLPDNAVVMDMTYRPLMTPFLVAARTRGLTIVDGLAMLIGQARPSFQAFYDRPAPELDVRAAALAFLGEAAA